jgi:hypothetical protein
MMTDAEWSDFEDMVTLGDQSRYESSWRSALTECAYRELKERREDEEWLKKKIADEGFTLRTKYLHRRDQSGARDVFELNDHEGVVAWGETLHAAVTAAKKAQR